MDKTRPKILMFLSVMGRESVGWHVQGMMAIGHRFPILHRGAKASDQLGLEKQLSRCIDWTIILKNSSIISITSSEIF